MARVPKKTISPPHLFFSPGGEEGGGKVGPGGEGGGVGVGGSSLKKR